MFLTFDISTASGFASAPNAERPDIFASNITVPVPQNGSSTIGGAKSWSVSTNALFITDDAGQKALMKAFVDGTNLQIELKNTGETVYFAGTCQITSIEIGATYDDVCTMDMELQGIGALKVQKEG